MPRKVSSYIEEILSAIGEIEEFTKDIDFDSYIKSEKTKAAVERKLLIIGEALNQLSKNKGDLEGEITDLKKIITLRNILVHSYFGVDDFIIYDVITTKLNQLKLEIIKIKKGIYEK